MTNRMGRILTFCIVGFCMNDVMGFRIREILGCWRDYNLQIRNCSRICNYLVAVAIAQLTESLT